MPFTVLLCTDGSDLADAALAEGLAVVPPDRVVLATVVDAIDPTLVVGTGMAGGVMTPATAHTLHEGLIDDAQAQLDATRLALDRADAEPTVIVGSAGAALCDLAASLPADVIVMGIGATAACAGRCWDRCPTTSCATPLPGPDHRSPPTATDHPP